MPRAAAPRARRSHIAYYPCDGYIARAGGLRNLEQLVLRAGELAEARRLAKAGGPARAAGVPRRAGVKPRGRVLGRATPRAPEEAG